MLALAVSAAILFRAYGGLPDRIPTHFDALGQPNGWGPKASLLLLPGVGAFVLLLLFLLRNAPPNLPFAVSPDHRERVRAISRTMAAWLAAVVMAGFCAMEAGLLESARTGTLAAGFPPSVGALAAATLGCLALFLYRMYRVR
ncbi:MAG TPA: DUF1648 domain-containing protein [Verrucomicrobiae bacterium]|nr:DUF1648 domain-containing protein [Verrucomicrobiae bacterium]